MKSVLAGAVANIVLDPVFIFMLGLGVNGAAVATVLSQFLSMLFVLKFFWSDKNEFPIDVHDLISFPYAKEIISLGLSSFVMQCTNSLVSAACNSVLIQTGGPLYVSVMTIVSSVRQILDTPILAVTEGASPVISYNFGAQKPKKVLEAIRMMAVIAIVYTCLMWLLIERFPLLFIKIFSDDAALQQLALTPLHLYFLRLCSRRFSTAGRRFLRR